MSINKPERFLPGTFILLFFLMINHAVVAQSLPACFSQVEVVAGISNSTVTSADTGTYSVVVSNVPGTVTSNDATLTVTAPNQPPAATISTPAAGTTYAAGTLINFSGTATDPENGALADSSYLWYVIFHHDTHTHPGPPATSGESSGSFTIPNTGETASDVFYRLYMVVTDPEGARDTAFTDIFPRTSAITLNTNPQGLIVTLDGQPFTAPLTVTSVEGMLRTISTPTPQAAGQSIYYFSNWSQGGAQTQTFATDVNEVTYTANFTPAPVAPTIIAQPESLTLPSGSSATFSVTATGTPPLTYQWRIDGNNITGAIDSSYTISSAAPANAGTYSVVVNNAYGSATSSDATLTIDSIATSELTFNTVPQGLNIEIDGTIYKTPVTITSEEGMLRTISTPSPQALGEGIYYFSNWSHGGEQTQTIITPANDSSYTAFFTTFVSPVYRNPDNPFNVTNGLDYSYYHGTWSNIPDFNTLYKQKAGTVTNFDLSPRTENDNFGFHFSGFISVPADGVYTFYTSSDEGSRLYIGDSLIVDNDGLHTAQERSGQIGLKAGLHHLSVDYFENAGGQSLNVGYESAGIAKQLVPDSAVFREQPAQYVFNPIADAYVRSGNYINVNLSAGATPSLITSGDSAAGDEYQTYLRFDISSLGANIASAKLRLYGALNNVGPSPVVVEVFNVPNWKGWLEHTITFSNKPPAEGGLIASATVSGTDSLYYEWDLTQLITDLRNRDIYYVSLMLKNLSGSGDNLVSFNSRENQNNKPELVINTNSLITEARPSPAVQQAIAKTAENSFSPDPSFSIYPNPVNNSFTIKYSPAFGNTRLQITGISGSLLKEVLLTESGTQTIRVDNLKEGLYVLSIYDKNKKYSQKILIRR